MEKVFTLKDSKRSFFKSYMTYLSPFLIAIFPLSYQLMATKLKIKYELAGAFVVTAILFIIIFGVIQYNKYKNRRIIVTSDSLQIIDSTYGEVSYYLFNELEAVKFPKEKELKKIGGQRFSLKFKYKKKMVFTSLIPYYLELRDYVMEAVKGIPLNPPVKGKT